MFRPTFFCFYVVKEGGDVYECLCGYPVGAWSRGAIVHVGIHNTHNHPCKLRICTSFSAADGESLPSPVVACTPASHSAVSRESSHARKLSPAVFCFWVGGGWVVDWFVRLDRREGFEVRKGCRGFHHNHITIKIQSPNPNPTPSRRSLAALSHRCWRCTPGRRAAGALGGKGNSRHRFRRSAADVAGPRGFVGGGGTPRWRCRGGG